MTRSYQLTFVISIGSLYDLITSYMRILIFCGMAIWLVFSCNSKTEEPIQQELMDLTKPPQVELTESNSNSNENELSSENNSDTLNYLALGDSYTIGET